MHALVLAATLLVLNKSDATLAFVDPASLQVLQKIPTGEGPHEVAVSSDGKIALVANYGTGPNPGTTLSVVDTGSRKELQRMKLPGLLRPHGLFVIGSHIYFTCEGSRVVARYDVPSGTIDLISGSGANGTHMAVVSADEKKIYTANIGSDSVSVIDLANAPRAIGVTQIAVGKGPEGIDLSPDGSELWTATRGDAAMSIIDTATGKVTKVVPTGAKQANRVKFTPDGKRVLVSDPPSNELLIFDAKTKELITKIGTAAAPSGILMTPDGRAFIACSGGDVIQILDLEKMAITGSFATGKTPDGMAWSPR
jgi:YVTN family beta-propeller protein